MLLAGLGGARTVGVMEITLRQLEYLVAAVNEGGFAAAGRACHVSQPSLSVQIARLERHLGVSLFERAARQVTPTPVAHEVARAAQQVLDAVAELERAARLAGALRVGAIETVAPQLFGPWLAAARASLPELRVVPAQGRTARLVDDVRTGRIDAAVLAEPVPSDLATLPIGFEAFWVLAAASDPIRTATLDELAGRHVLLLEEGHCLAAQSIDVCTALRVERTTVVPGATLDTLAEMVAYGQGVTIVPAMAARRYAERGDVRVVPFEPDGPGRTLVLATRPGGSASELAALASLAADVLSGAAV